MPHARRIAFVCTRVEGGIGRNILRLSQHCLREGREVEIWVSDPLNDFPDEIDPLVKIKTLSTTHGIVGVPFVWYHIIKFKPDVIITPSERLTRICVRARALLLRKPKIVACVHNFYSKMYQGLSSKKSAKRKKMIAKIYPNVDKVVGVSLGAANDIQEYCGAKLSNIQVIYNPIVESTFDREHTMELPACYNRGSVIVNVGNICAQKNQSFLIKSFCALRKKRFCSLVILGGGDSSDLTRQAQATEFSEDIHIVGHQSNPFPFIARADVFALSSSYEGFGNVVVESLLCGTPVVSTASGGPEEILTEPYLGTIVPAFEVEAFADAMDRWLDANVEKQKLSAFAEQHFSVSAIGRQYLAMIDSL